MFQFIKFNIVGLLNTLVDFLVFSLLIWLGLHYFWAQCLSYGAGMTNSYAMNKSWTFAHREPSRRRLILRFIAVNAVSLLLSLALLSGFHDRLLVPILWSKIIATGFTTIINFAGSKLWVFRAS